MPRLGTGWGRESGTSLRGPRSLAEAVRPSLVPAPEIVNLGWYEVFLQDFGFGSLRHKP